MLAGSAKAGSTWMFFRGRRGAGERTGREAASARWLRSSGTRREA